MEEITHGGEYTQRMYTRGKKSIHRGVYTRREVHREGSSQEVHREGSIHREKFIRREVHTEGSTRGEGGVHTVEFTHGGVYTQEED